MKLAVTITILMCVVALDAYPTTMDDFMSMMGKKPQESPCSKTPKKTPVTPKKTPATTPETPATKVPETPTTKAPETTPTKAPATTPTKTPKTPKTGGKNAGAITNSDDENGVGTAFANVDDEQASAIALLRGRGSAAAFSSS